MTQADRMQMKNSGVGLLLCFAGVLTGTSASRVKVDGNGYYDVVVGIHETTSEAMSAPIIENIKQMFREASPILYRATKQQVYFRNVTILLPASWTNSNASLASWESYDDADVKVEPANPAYNNTPYTVQYGQCGMPGKYLHLTPRYATFMSSPTYLRIYGPPGKILVHEWAHYRWGTFDEYGIPGDAAYPLFYRSAGQSLTSAYGAILPNLCADKSAESQFTLSDVNGNSHCSYDSQTGIYDKNCRFTMKPSFQPSTSLLSDHKISSVVDFCDVNTHNMEAPSKQNAKCGYKSAWEVMRKHPDFANESNPGLSPADIEPVFKIVKSSPTRFVLVADVSGSMADFNRITLLNQSAKRWIKYDIPRLSKVGIVSFHSVAALVSDLEEITDDASRQRLMDRVSFTANGETCIGCGLQKAADLLKRSGNGGVILLISDGQNNVFAPTIQDALANIMKQEIRLVSIAIGPQADTSIENMATQTGGKSYYVPDDDPAAWNSAFSGSLTFQPSVTMDNLEVKILENRFQSQGNEVRLRDKVYVDSSIGKNLKVRVEWNRQMAQDILSLSLAAPNGLNYTNATYDVNLNAAFIHVDMAMGGEWTVRFDATNLYPTDVFHMIVTSLARDGSTGPIHTLCEIANGGNVSNPAVTPVVITATVKRGSNSVLGARVQAYVEKPNLTVDLVELYDNGANADATKYDGVYSQFYIGVNVSGRYSVKCQVWDDGNSFVDDGFIGSPIFVNDPDTPYCCGSETPLSGNRTYTGNFTRNSDGGAFRVQTPLNTTDNYPPSRVSDLALVSMSSSNMTVTLTWTAPGDELGFGTVSTYEVRYSDNITNVMEGNFDNSNATLLSVNDVVAGSLTPLAAGGRQLVTFDLQEGLQNTTYFFAVKAKDKAQKSSPVSNIVSVFITPVPPSSSASHFSVFMCIEMIVGLWFVLLLH